MLLAGLACLTLVAGEAKPSGPAVAPIVTATMDGLKPVALSTLEEGRPFERTPVSSAPGAPFVLRHRSGESSVWLIEGVDFNDGGLADDRRF